MSAVDSLEIDLWQVYQASEVGGHSERRLRINEKVRKVMISTQGVQGNDKYDIESIVILAGTNDLRHKNVTPESLIFQLRSKIQKL